MLDAGDLQRRRLARDLHDGAQQKFVTAVINLQLAKAKLGSDPSRAERYLEAALRQSESGLSELRAFVAGVHPPVLTHLGLGAAVASLGDEFPIPLEIKVVPDRLPGFLEAGLYFFIAEALTNVVKHARATGASVHVTTTATRLTTEVQDDGIGGARLSDGGSGLIGLVDRIQALGGDFSLTSPPNRGTRLGAAIPLPGDFNVKSGAVCRSANGLEPEPDC